MMNHIEDIRSFVRTLHQSKKFHALVISSGPGFAKSTTVENVLKELTISFQTVGSYSTPLELYNTLCTFPSSTIVIDDAANIFNQASTMAILKAATWTNAGSEGKRIITWRSTSEKVMAPSAEFAGKIILLSNKIPKGIESDALLSRTLYLELCFSDDEIASMLLEAARQKVYYEDTELAVRVAEHLINNVTGTNNTGLNLRSLQIAYELAQINPNNWPLLIERIFPKKNPNHIILSLNTSGAKVEQQAKQFAKFTGLSRRTFFTYRRALKIHKNQRHVSDTNEKVQVALAVEPRYPAH